MTARPPRRWSPSLLLLVALASTPLIRAQSPGQPTPSTAPTPAQSPSFEVAVIRLNKTGGGNSDSDTDNNRFTAVNVSLKSLLQYDAYGIPGSRIFGGPKWLESARFDVEAKMDDETMARLKTLDRQQRNLLTQAIFQQLLADRFQLKTHWETRELPIYALVAGKSGPKLKPTTDTAGNSGTSSSGNGSSVSFKATGLTLEQFTESLTSSASPDLGREVIDKTGIQGRYDITLNWIRDSGANASGDPAQGSGPSLFTAIQEQAGLKLEPSKGPVRVLVIDHAEMPSDN